MRIIHAKTDSSDKRRVVAADENVFADLDGFDTPDAEDEDLDDEEPTEVDTELQQDSSTIEIDNNITNHLIAECENCHGIFISAMLASDQIIESINGICPLCSKDTEQTLKWIIKDYPE